MPALLPDRIEYDDSVERRMDLHQVGVGLCIQHGLLRSIALNLKATDRGLRGFALQIEGLSQLIISGFGLFSVSWFFFASMRDTISAFCDSNSALRKLSSACVSSVSSLAQAAFSFACSSAT